MNLGFQDQFVPMVEEGSKRHSIRAGDRWEAGRRADLYTRPRQPKKFKHVRIEGSDGCICLGDGLFGMACHAERHARYDLQQVAGMRLLFRAVVLKVEPITVWLRSPAARLHPDERCFAGALGIAISDEILSDEEANAFAYRDGFRERPLRPGGPLDALAEMALYWIGKYGKDGGMERFTGQLIHWDYENRFTAIADTCFHVNRFRAMRGIV